MKAGSLATLRVLLLAVLLAGVAGCGGRGKTSRSAPEAERSAGRLGPAAPTVSSDDLREAEKVTRAYCEALIKGEYQEALSHTELIFAPEEQRKSLEQTLKAGIEPKGLTRILSIGPARQDPQSPQNILVPYSIEGKESLARDAIVRRSGPTGELLISGGI